MEVINLAPDNVQFHAIIEREAVRLEYGTLAVNVQLINGRPQLQTLSVVTSKRKKYTFDKIPNVL
jgi:hypothetical protein